MIACFALSVGLVSAGELSATGYGATADAAKLDALTSLSTSFYVDVKSSVEIKATSESGHQFKMTNKLQSELPLFGVKTSCSSGGKQYSCTSIMDFHSAEGLYLGAMSRTLEAAAFSYKKLQDTDDDTALAVAQGLLVSLEHLEKLNVVYSRIATETESTPDFALPLKYRQDAKTRVRQLEESAASINQATLVLLKAIPGKHIEALPPLLPSSREVTPFSREVHKSMEKNLINQGRLGKGSTLRGEYTPAGDFVHINYVLDHDGEPVAASSVKLKNSALGDLRVKAIAPDFDRLLKQGYAVSSDFRAEVATSKGRNALVFYDGDAVQIIVKLNKPGYFYIVGYSKNDYEETSYLLDIQDAKGDRKFISYINPSNVNKWISLGEFGVEAPFGLESLQLYASTDDLVGAIPAVNWDPQSGYYVVSKDIVSAVSRVSNTRGLKRIKKESPDYAEASLLFNTLKRD
jgi:hypothetical protein